MAVTFLDILHSSDSFFFGLVSQHGAKGDVPNHTDMGDLCAVFLINNYTTPLVDFDADILKTQPAGIGSTANSDKDNISFKLEPDIV